MIAWRVRTLPDALAAGLGPNVRRAKLVHAAQLEIGLPPGASETAGDDADAIVAAVDATRVAEGTAALRSAAGTRVAWVMPDARPGVWGWVVSRARRLAPVAIEDACDAFRRAGIVDVRVTRVDGSAPLVVLSGVSTGS